MMLLEILMLFIVTVDSCITITDKLLLYNVNNKQVKLLVISLNNINNITIDTKERFYISV